VLSRCFPQHITLRPAAAGLATTGHKYEKPLLVLMVLVALVLLISCGNTDRGR
jgi:hypothetical protein